MEKYLLFGLFLFLACLCVHPTQATQFSDSCTYKIQGSIVDAKTKQPIPFAAVMIKNKQQGVVADKHGKFLLDKLCGREHTLVCSSVGYKPATHHHDAHHKEPVIYMAPSASELKSVVVEGEAIVGDMQSIALDKIDGAELATKATRSLASAIGDIQGITFISTGSNVQLPVIHGLYGNRILIINNGVKHGFQNWGSDHAPEIDITSADNISVLKGAAGVRYGPEALGGAVVVEGHPLNLSEKLHGNIASGYQTNGKGYHTNAHLGAGYEKFSYHLGGNYLRMGDRHAPDYSLTNTGMAERSANAGFRYHLPQWDFKVYYSYVDQDLGLLRSSVAESGNLFARSLTADEPLIIRDFSYDINEPRQNTTHHLANLAIDWHSDLGKLALLLSRQINQRQEYDVRRNADLPIIDLDLRTTDTRLEWSHPSFGGLEGTLGLQYFSQNNDNNPGTGTTPFIPNYNTSRFSVFVIESIQKGSNLFELGLRLDHEYNSVRGRETSQAIFRNDYSFTNVTASLGFVRDLSAHWQLRTNLGSAWRTPNMAELYSFGQHGFKTQFGLWRYYTNENGELRTDRVLTEEDDAAEPERGYKWINELTHQKDDHTFTLTAYAHLIDNYIFDRPVAVIGTIRGPMPVFIIDQADALFAGADLTYSRTFTKNLKGTLGASYLWSQNIRKNETLINQPPVNINTELSWKTPSFLGLDASKLTLQTSYSFRQFQAPRTVTPGELISGAVEITPDAEIFDFKDAPEGYFLGHFRWEWGLGSLGGQVEIRNILNTPYRDYLNQMRYFADEPGRNFLFTINYKF
ncbi:TonB-dependent receptor [Fulvivirgaceae bacterium BMA12]|uniref:TonB-dependent receptor n=1 Tax=Agaribacillus aureus TaxID=3051825 RepID=A0ABT8LAD0_9BACT|nr:TonB-dependent receptor [Fulvivirgaceae bacterium BMA12]